METPNSNITAFSCTSNLNLISLRALALRTLNDMFLCGYCQGEKGDMGQEGDKGEKGELGLKGKEGPPGSPGLTGVRVSGLSFLSHFFFFFCKLTFTIHSFSCFLILFFLSKGSGRETWQNWGKRQTRVKGIDIKSPLILYHLKTHMQWHRHAGWSAVL